MTKIRSVIFFLHFSDQKYFGTIIISALMVNILHDEFMSVIEKHETSWVQK